jgi:hypothetical protein
MCAAWELPAATAACLTSPCPCIGIPLKHICQRRWYGLASSWDTPPEKTCTTCTSLTCLQPSPSPVSLSQAGACGTPMQSTASQVGAMRS